DTLVTLQKFFEEDCTSHTGMSQTEDNINAVAMKITADIMQTRRLRLSRRTANELTLQER
ncbi:hypothetical protein NX036_16895, partial [Escherichia coli]|nr:hypothetical protein [Escherichia coli]